MGILFKTESKLFLAHHLSESGCLSEKRWACGGITGITATVMAEAVMAEANVNVHLSQSIRMAKGRIYVPTQFMQFAIGKSIIDFHTFRI